MAFKWPVDPQVLGLTGDSPVYLAAKVIPMGWINSVSLFQHLHRRLGLSEFPVGAGFAEDSEMRRDRAIPVGAGQLCGGWLSYYLDDFDAPEIVCRFMVEELRGTVSAVRQRQREAYKRAGVQISEDKAHRREPRVERMGAQVDGLGGWLGVSQQKKLEVGYFMVWAMTQRCLSQKVVLMILGRLVRCFEFRRPLMSLLNEVWPKDPKKYVRQLRKRDLNELLQAVAVLPKLVHAGEWAGDVFRCFRSCRRNVCYCRTDTAWDRGREAARRERVQQRGGSVSGRRKLCKTSRTWGASHTSGLPLRWHWCSDGCADATPLPSCWLCLERSRP